MVKGACQIIDLKDFNFTDDTSLVAEGIIEKIDRTKKVILLSGITIDNEKKRDVFIKIKTKLEQGELNNITIYTDNFNDTIISTNAPITIDTILYEEGQYVLDIQGGIPIKSSSLTEIISKGDGVTSFGIGNVRFVPDPEYAGLGKIYADEIYQSATGNTLTIGANQVNVYINVKNVGYEADLYGKKLTITRDDVISIKED